MIIHHEIHIIQYSEAFNPTERHIRKMTPIAMKAFGRSF